MVEIECRGEPCVRPLTKTGIEPMVKNKYKSFAFGHRFDPGFCSRANTHGSLGILHLPVFFLVPRLCLGMHARRLCRLYHCLGGRAAKYAFPGRAWEREKYKSFAFGHRFDFGFCSRANTRFAPT